MRSFVKILSGRHTNKTGWINGDFFNLNPRVSKVRVHFNRDGSRSAMVRIDHLGASLTLPDLLDTNENYNNPFHMPETIDNKP